MKEIETGNKLREISNKLIALIPQVGKPGVFQELQRIQQELSKI